ncbi:hypothetical protein [Streptomyces sp. NPDC102370]|uniref:hypothetical protein n=1 Tax=Streptomyces sp. NPDC102370 TaxID=3366163 RepID=UPI0038108D01
MNVNDRKAYAIARAALAVTVASSVAGLALDNGFVSRAGILLTVATLPAVCRYQIRQATRVRDRQLTEAHRAGYVLALDHVARGLLDVPAAPSPGPGTTPLAPANVILLHPLVADPLERKAQ